MSSANIETEDLLSGNGPLSYKGRFNGREVINNLSRKISYSHSYTPASAKNLSKFLALKHESSYDSVSTSPSTSYASPSWQTRFLDEESLMLMDMIQNEAVSEAIKNFYNSYIASANSDAVYRLGQVTRVKQLFTNVKDIYGNIVQTGKDTANVVGQTDAFGRLDTVTNLRTKFDIEAAYANNQLITAGYSEFYVSWFFPPFTNENFKDLNANADVINSLIASGTLTADSTTSGSSTAAAISNNALATSAATKYLNSASANDIYRPTYDYIDMMCSRDGFTYRTPGFKAVNDNINFLQYIFEQCTGIVSTYLTEWDISLYIQEGMLSDYQTNKNVWLCNRITMDNPQGITNDGAYTWGALNAAVSKLGVDGNGPSNQKTWIPSYYYASAYWMPYNYADRGDGLGKFWDYAIDELGRYANRTFKMQQTVAGRIQHDDEIYAAFAGWKTFDDIQYYQLLYTTPDDGLSNVDGAHLQESSDGYADLNEELKAILDGVYADDTSLGFPDTSLVETIGADDTGGIYQTLYLSGKTLEFNKKIISYEMNDYYDADSKRMVMTNYYKDGKWVTMTDAEGHEMVPGMADASGAGSANSVNMSSEGNISIMGCPIPGSSLLKLFLKKDSIKSSAMSIADKKKSSSGFWNPSGSSSGKTKNSISEDPSSASSLGEVGETLNTNPNESEHYSNPMGIPRLNPALYGGPHGSAFSPQSLQAYFQADNQFLRPIARVEPSITDWTREDKDYYYQGIESQYRYQQGNNTGKGAAYVGRSPSDSLHTLVNGHCETVPSYMYVYEETYGYLPANTGYRKVDPVWSWYWGISYYLGGWGFWGWSIAAYIGMRWACVWPRLEKYANFPTTAGRNKANTGPDTVRYENYYGGYWTWITADRAQWGSKYWANDWYVGSTVSNGGQRGRVVKVYNGRSGRWGESHGEWAWLSFNYNFWWESEYEFQIYTYVPTRLGRFGNFIQKTFNRPLMHSEPMLKWQIAKYRMIPFDPRPSGTPSGFFNFLSQKWGTSYSYHYADRYFHLYKETPTEMYRLTTPTHSVASRTNVRWYEKVTNSEYCPPYHDTHISRRSGENTIIEKILCNASAPGQWHYPFYCIMNDYNGSEEALRKKRGPRYIAQIPTRVKQIHLTYTYIDHDDDKHKCHRDCHYWNITRSASYAFIEVDLENTKNFWASTNYIDKVFEANSTTPDLMADWPTKASMLQDRVTDIMSLMKPYTSMQGFDFAGEGYGYERNHGIRGIGIYSSIPALLKKIPDQKSFEDANEYMNIATIMGMTPRWIPEYRWVQEIAYWATYRVLRWRWWWSYWEYYSYPVYRLVKRTYWKLSHARDDAAGEIAAKTTQIKNLPLCRANLVGFGNPGQVYEDTPNGRYYIPGGRRIYTRELLSSVDPGMDLFLKNLYLTATLFIPDRKGTLDSNLSPYITNVSSCLRTALKMVKHQKAYLVYGMELFENVIEPTAVIDLLKKSVDKRVTSVSCSHWPLGSGQINPYYKPSSPFYNYWIEKAYDLYMGLDPNTKQTKSCTPMQAVKDSFQARITQIDNFVRDALDFINNKDGNYQRLSAKEWSYSDFRRIYEIFGNFRQTFENTDQTVEEYFYSYLNVLYEYRKYFINKRCNKQDGTLWACRQFESIIPALNTAKTTAPDSDSPLVSTTEPGLNVYNINMKAVQNTLEDKAIAIRDDETLSTDRICRLYILIQYATKKDYDNFIDSLVNGTPDLDNEILKAQRWDKKEAAYKIVYIKKPKNGTYQLLSKEYLSNKKAIEFNARLEELYNKGILDLISKQAKEKEVNEYILDCIFPIIWNKEKANDILENYLKAGETLRNCELAQRSTKELYQNVQVEYKNIEADNESILNSVDKDYTLKYNNFIALEKVLEDFNDIAPTFFTIYGYNIRTVDNITGAVSNNNYNILKDYINGNISFSSLPDSIKQYVATIKDTAWDPMPLSSVKTAILDKADAYYDAANKISSAKSIMNAALATKRETYAECKTIEHIFRQTNIITVARNHATSHSKILDETKVLSSSKIKELVNKYLSSNSNYDNTKISSYITDASKVYAFYLYYYNNEVVNEESFKFLDAVKVEGSVDPADEGIVNLAKIDYDTATSSYNTACAEYDLAKEAYMKSLSGKSKEEFEAQYTWICPGDGDPLYPNIAWNVPTGVDLSAIMGGEDNDADAMAKLCALKKYYDYWVITIPQSAWPYDIGYDTALKIKTYEPDAKDAINYEMPTLYTTIAGPFAYQLYPITENQNAAIAAVGANFGSLEEQVKKTFL